MSLPSRRRRWICRRGSEAVGSNDSKGFPIEGSCRRRQLMRLSSCDCPYLGNRADFPSSDLGRASATFPQRGRPLTHKKCPARLTRAGHFHFTSLLSLTTRILSSPVCVVTVNSKLYAVSNS